MDDLSPAELREVRKAIRAAYERGRAAERKEFDAFLSRMRAIKELNGSGDAFLKAYSDREQSREDRRPDPHAAVAEAMLAHAEEAMAAGDDHLPGVEALRELLGDPAELGRVLAEGGADDESVAKAVWTVLKATPDQRDSELLADEMLAEMGAES